ncbi:MAG: hypothetical protein SNJ70_05130 [Armatimonadota bacterium]
MVTINRPGWTQDIPERSFPKDGMDGNWLGTGVSIRAIADTLEIMPEGSISPELMSKINKLLEKEIESIVDDWETKRPWFVKPRNPITNQWILPTAGLVRACLLLGKDKHKKLIAWCF